MEMFHKSVNGEQRIGQTKFLEVIHFCVSQTDVEVSEYQIFEYQLALTPELETEILSMGEKAEVLAPQELKEKIKERLSLTLKRY